MYNNLLVNAENIYVYIYDSNKLALCALNQHGTKIMMLCNKQIFKLRDTCKCDLVDQVDCLAFKFLEFGKRVYPVFIKQTATIYGREKCFLQSNITLYEKIATDCDLPIDDILEVFKEKFPMTKKTYSVQQLLDIQNKINNDISKISISHTQSMFLDF